MRFVFLEAHHAVPSQLHDNQLCILCDLRHRVLLCLGLVGEGAGLILVWSVVPRADLWPRPGAWLAIGLVPQAGSGWWWRRGQQLWLFPLALLGQTKYKGMMEDHQRALTVKEDKTKKDLLGNEGMVQWGV